jgi:hypothetical protein
MATIMAERHTRRAAHLPLVMSLFVFIVSRDFSRAICGTCAGTQFQDAPWKINRQLVGTKQVTA